MTTRKTLTVNQQIDALLKRQANPARKTPAKKSARSVVLVAAKNPRKAAKNPAVSFARDKATKAPDLPYVVQRYNMTSGEWGSLASFALVDYATRWAKSYHRDFPNQTVRVVDRF